MARAHLMVPAPCRDHAEIMTIPSAILVCSIMTCERDKCSGTAVVSKGLLRAAQCLSTPRFIRAAQGAGGDQCTPTSSGFTASRHRDVESCREKRLLESRQTPGPGCRGHLSQHGASQQGEEGKGPKKSGMTSKRGCHPRTSPRRCFPASPATSPPLGLCF